MTEEYRNNEPAGSYRWIDIVFAIALIVGVIGGAALFKIGQDVRANNANLICSLGELISDTPMSQRPGEAPRDFSARIRALREFAMDLRDLDECDPSRPVEISVPARDRGTLERFRERRRQEEGPRRDGGGAGAASEPPMEGVVSQGQPPGRPPQPPGGGRPPQTTPPTPPTPPRPPRPPRPPAPPQPPSPLDPLLEPVCETTRPLLGDLLCL